MTVQKIEITARSFLIISVEIKFESLVVLSKY